MSNDDLKEFFAVTTTSLYKVVALGEKDCPYIEKIALNGDSKIPVGTKIGDAPMLAVANYLQFYYPEGHSLLSPQTSEVRELERVNTMWWRMGTSSIVALFLKEEEAWSCFNRPELLPCDQRWIDKTKEVLERIGDNHPNVTVCHWRDLSLLPVQNS